MAEELGTRDVLEQDLRALRAELHSEVGGLRAEMNGRFDRIEQRMDQRFMWLCGLLVALVIGVAGLWLR